MPKPPRFFAQLFSFRFCCPKCGQLHTVVGGRSRSSRFRKISHRVKCHYCGKVGCLGLLYWECRHGKANRGGHEDQVPNALELAQIRDEVERDPLTGRFMPVRKGPHEPINRVIREERELEKELK